MLNLLHVFSSPISLLPRSRLGEPSVFRLYLIRTDSVNLSGERVTAGGICVNNLFADFYNFVAGLSSIITHENFWRKTSVLQGYLYVLDMLTKPEGGKIVMGRAFETPDLQSFAVDFA